jgi:uncharacterized membrane protein
VFLGFALSFLVIYMFWSAHEATFAAVEQATAGLRLANMFWLLVVAFLPFPTALVGRQATTTSTPLYIGTMCVLSLLTSTMAELSARAVRRGEPPETRALRSRPTWRRVLLWTTPGVFGLCAALSAFSPDVGLYGLLLLVVVRVAEVAVPRLVDVRS